MNKLLHNDYQGGNEDALDVSIGGFRPQTAMEYQKGIKYVME